MEYKSKRQRLEIITSQMKNERVSFLSHYRDLGDYILPRRPRFTVTDGNKGDKRNQKILDSTATLAARSLRSGMMSGVTSPARPWFRLTTNNQKTAEIASVKQWLHEVTEVMTTIFLRSNLYQTLPTLYGDLGVFGTAAMLVEEDFDSVMRFYPFAIGSYCISNNHQLKVDRFYREYRMTVRQLIEAFGYNDPGVNGINWDRFSTHVRNMYDQGALESWIDVCHYIGPNPEFDESKKLSKFKRFESCYFEAGTSNITDRDQNNYLSEKGYDYFPVLCPRWEVTAEDVYGTSCPGMDALPDVKQLQTGEKRSAQAIEKKVNPPMKGPTSMQNQKASILPGDVVYDANPEKFGPSHEVNLSIVDLENKQQQVRDRIRRAFFEDLFLMLSSTDRRNITAREIDERHEEKLLALGPVLEQLNQDLLDPLIDIAFTMANAQGRIPEPPEVLANEELKVEYISIMAQAQKLVGIAGHERFAGFIAQLLPMYPGIADKVDFDQLVDVYGDITSINPTIVRSDEDVAAIKEQAAQAQQAAQAAETISQGAVAAKNLSQADMEGDNALNRIIANAEAGSLVEGIV